MVVAGFLWARAARKVCCPNRHPGERAWRSYSAYPETAAQTLKSGHGAVMPSCRLAGRDHSRDDGAADLRFYLEPSADLMQALAHAGQAHAIVALPSRPQARPPDDTLAGIRDAEDDDGLALGVPAPQLDARGGAAGMAADIGQCLLHHAE